MPTFREARIFGRRKGMGLVPREPDVVLAGITLPRDWGIGHSPCPAFVDVIVRDVRHRLRHPRCRLAFGGLHARTFPTLWIAIGVIVALALV